MSIMVRVFGHVKEAADLKVKLFRVRNVVDESPALENEGAVPAQPTVE
jgi:hypothetical protein